MNSMFLFIWLASLNLAAADPEAILRTTAGDLPAQDAGIILAHEHIFTDLRGPEAAGYGKADESDVLRVMKPLLLAAREQGIGTIVECTTIGVGRNVPIIARLARETGLKVIVPTGVYGRAHFAPKDYAALSEDELTEWMVREITVGIDGTSIRAGFIKTAASENELKPLEEKFLRASGRAARQTGVAIASHTTSGAVARQQADILHELNLPLDRFVWVHAQTEKDLVVHRELARRGVYIELDSVGSSPEGDEALIKMIRTLVDAGFADGILISQDAGWYNPSHPNGGKQRGYTALVASFVPRLEERGFSIELVQKLTRENPARAFAIRPPAKLKSQ